MVSDRIVQELVAPGALREFLIRSGGPNDKNMEAVIDVVTDLYAVSPWQAIQPIYTVAMELSELRERQRFEVNERKKAELKEIAQSKFLSILEVFREFDRHEQRAQL